MQGLAAQTRGAGSACHARASQRLSASRPHLSSQPCSSSGSSGSGCGGGCSSTGRAALHAPSFHVARRVPGVVRAAEAVATPGDFPEEAVVVAKKGGRTSYRPKSFQELVADAATAVLAAVEDGHTWLEVEFPPVPTNQDAYKGASDMFIDANVQLALSGAKQIAATGKRVHVLMPDQGEYSRSYKLCQGSLDLLPGVSLGHLREAEGSSPLNALQTLFSGSAPSSVEQGKAADVFIVVNVTSVELGVLEKYTTEVAAGKVMVLWNLELDTLRGDLGIVPYPPKDLQHRFLSFFKPAFYVRQRDYSKTVNVSPFIVNYSGMLFREYPGPWQVMLKLDSREYACIAEDSQRYELGQVKEELMAAMGLNTEEEGSAMAFLRRGYKTSTWWEDDVAKDQSTKWRT